MNTQVLLLVVTIAINARIDADVEKFVALRIWYQSTDPMSNQ